MQAWVIGVKIATHTGSVRLGLLIYLSSLGLILRRDDDVRGRWGGRVVAPQGRLVCLAVDTNPSETQDMAI